MPKQTPPEAEALLKPAEVGERIGQSRATVYRLINAGLIETVTLPVAKPGPKPRKGAVRVPASAVEKFIASLRSDAKAS